MTTSTPSVPHAMAAPPRAFAAVFWGGLLAGIFDITQAFIGFGFLGAKPFRILQRIAGGVFGARSMQIGWTSALLGLIFHFTIAFTAAAVYYLASRMVRVMVEYVFLCGLLYGELVFLFMYFVVLPLSAPGPAGPLFRRHVHHRTHRPNVSSGTADCAFRKTFLPERGRRNWSSYALDAMGAPRGSGVIGTLIRIRR